MAKELSESIVAQEQPFLNTTEPNLTRIFNYLTGGVTNFEIDRKAATQMLRQFPLMRMWVRLGKAFIQEAVKELYQKGFVQFLDLGSSIPSEEGFHTFAPAGTVIYTDINPVAVSYGNSLFAKLNNVEYIHGDVRHIDDIFSQEPVSRLVDPSQKLAIGLNFLLLYLSPEENKVLTQKLYDWAPYGSQIFQIFYTRSVEEDHPDYLAFQQMMQSVGIHMRLYTLEENLALMTSWRQKKVVSVMEYLGMPDDVINPKGHHALGLDYKAAFFEKA